MRAAGSGVTISQYYGRASRASRNSSASINQQQLVEIIGSLKEQWRNEIIRNLKDEMRSQLEEKNRRSLENMKQEFKEAIKIKFSQKGSQYSPLIEPNIQQMGAHVNTKGSNAETSVNPSGEDVVEVIPSMGLFVQRDRGTQLVALEKILEGGGGLTIHSVTYVDDMVRVSVEKVIDGDVEVSYHTSKI